MSELRTTVIRPRVVRKTVITVGQGPAGAPANTGPGGSDAHYVHQQNTPAATWTINHNLGKRPAIQVFDSAGQECEGLLTHVTLAQAVVEFSAPFSGVATCN